MATRSPEAIERRRIAARERARRLAQDPEYREQKRLYWMEWYGENRDDRLEKRKAYDAVTAERKKEKAAQVDS